MTMFKTTQWLFLMPFAVDVVIYLFYFILFYWWGCVSFAQKEYDVRIQSWQYDLHCLDTSII